MKEIITSAQNKIIKLAVSLKHKKYREETDLFIVEGVRLLEEAAASSWSIKYCIYCEDTVQNERVNKILELLDAKSCRLLQVPRAIYEKVSDTEEPQGIMAIVEKQEYNIEDVLANSSKPVFVILDSVQDPGNVGTVIRTAAAAGCAGVILTTGCADVFAAKTVRASMGSLFYQPIFSGLSKEEVITLLAKHQITIMATALENAKIYFDVDFTASVAIVFGNEGQGVSKEFLEIAKEKLYIPLLGNVESLNVAASAAVILYEAVRQCRHVSCNF